MPQLLARPNYAKSSLILGPCLCLNSAIFQTPSLYLYWAHEGQVRVHVQAKLCTGKLAGRPCIRLLTRRADSLTSPKSLYGLNILGVCEHGRVATLKVNWNPGLATLCVNWFHRPQNCGTNIFIFANSIMNKLGSNFDMKIDL